MHRRWLILAVLPYIIPALFIVPVALLVKWAFVAWLGSAMPNVFVVHAMLLLAALVLACGIVGLVVLTGSVAIVAMHYCVYCLRGVLAPSAVECAEGKNHRLVLKSVTPSIVGCRRY
jgi:hypothetical protein